MVNFPRYAGDVPYLTTAQMVEVDCAMTNNYRIELMQMMENAGRNLAHLARAQLLGGDPRGKRVIVLAGTGGNGGGALVCARHLHNYGAEVRVYVSKPLDAYKSVPAHQLEILHRMRVPAAQAGDLNTALAPALIVDGLIGYSLSGAPRGTVADMIHWANQSSAPVLALDIPTGIDMTSGTLFDPAIQAAATMTLALPKEGLRAPGVVSHVGALYLADISVPPELYTTLGIKVGHIFAHSSIIQLA